MYVQTEISAYRGSLWVVIVPHVHVNSFPDGILYFFRINVRGDGFPSEPSLSDFVSKLKKERRKGKGRGE